MPDRPEPDAGLPADLKRARRLFKLRLYVDYWGLDFVGHGFISNLSVDGAFIFRRSTAVPNGAEVHLLFAFSPDGERITLRSQVLRQDRLGFGVRFLAGENVVRRIFGAALPDA